MSDTEKETVEDLQKQLADMQAEMERLRAKNVATQNQQQIVDPPANNGFPPGNRRDF
ncbi:uncharacterized protein LOC125502025 isoform X2 [Athalia rosae]|uniref:uncharacterized protein LOC125502025 isoform X2 n=1 Tax=Athalia rosae TaxID=37344 RepID=UPI0020332E66|nr:uncharacterized protein LOC125502025 isoform X2 [Athalia rosae]